MVVVSSNDLHNWNKSVTLKNKYDIATLISAYKKCISVYSPEYIQCVVERDGYYGFVLSESGEGNFDLFQTINSDFNQHGLIVNCANAVLMFPESISRGEYSEPEVQKDDSGTGVFDDDDAPTGLLDDSDFESSHYLLHIKTNMKLPVNFLNGIVIGRSTSKTDYAVDNSMLSRVHARFYYVDGKYFVEDLGSKNGTFVNNLRVRPNSPVEIKEGSAVKLANEMFKFV